MRKRAGSNVEVESLEQFDALVTGGAKHMHGWVLQNLDLTGRSEQLLALDPSGALLLGCTIDPRVGPYLRLHRALIFPNIPRVPFDPYRSQLYTPEELYDGLGEHGYDKTPDAKIYAWSRYRDGDITYPLARALHDHSIDTALSEELADKRAVGVMGGHALDRDDAGYLEAVRLGRALTLSGHYVATGGGPGAMEAANLGAYLSDQPADVLEAAIGELSRAPSFHTSIGRWASVGLDVRRKWPAGQPSLGIPTWFYGHEPPNPFANKIAKYFQNSLREDTLLRHCTGGIVFLPGAGGTVQEIFQDTCENYYADPATIAPMVLVGTEYWGRTVPAWPLLRTLAAGRPMERAVHLVDSVDEAIDVIAQPC
ncbi:MAG: LOG family protein [Nocardioidaceae bacterium]